MQGDPCILVKTQLGMERIAAARITEVAPWLKAEPAPSGFKGLVLVYGCRSLEDDARLIEDNVVEADRVIPVLAVTRADPRLIGEMAARLAKSLISPDECFAVRTTRRGRHGFISIDVNVVVGDAVRKATGACVNLSYPDKIVIVEIIGGMALVSVLPGSFEWKKMRPGKHPVLRLMRRISVVQMPYLGPLDACRNMGVRIGREVQNFEVRELVVAPAGMVDGRQLAEFLNGVFEGIESRFDIQRRSYHRRVERVPVRVMDLHQLVRDRKGREALIVLEPEGEPVSSVADRLWEIVRGSRRISILVGSREGIPLGVYRYADLVLDIAPGITLSTDYAAASALIALATVLGNRIGALDEDTDNTGSGEGRNTAADNRDQA
ncbi:MAG: SPOUT family RNA methylase [Desulfurococcales archaeon]|nr:SPOUT family RNA methylase [Desulfurococcales archaeon]